MSAASCPRWEQGGRCWSRGRRRVRTASPADKDLLQLPGDNPDLWERIKSGQVTLNNVVCKAPTADLSLIERTTEQFTLEARTIEELDAKINPPPTTNGTTPCPPSSKPSPPQRAVEIMKAWAYHPLTPPITFDEGIRIYTSLGMRGDPKEPDFFYSDLAETEADSFLLTSEEGISTCQVRLSNWLPEEYWEHSRPRACAYYSDFVQAFRVILGDARTSEDEDDYSTSRWVTDEQVSVILETRSALVLLTLKSPQRTRNFLDELEAEANGEEIGDDYF